MHCLHIKIIPVEQYCLLGYVCISMDKHPRLEEPSRPWNTGFFDTLLCIYQTIWRHITVPYFSKTPSEEVGWEMCGSGRFWLRFMSIVEAVILFDSFLVKVIPVLLTYWLTYLLTPWSRVLLEKLTIIFADSQEITRIYGTRKFFTVPTRARHLSLSWANSIQSPRHPPTSWKSILILSSHLRLGLPNGLLPSGFPTNTLCTTLSSPIRATCPAHLIRLDFTTRTIPVLPFEMYFLCELERIALWC
jgi:hypothetical protein